MVGHSGEASCVHSILSGCVSPRHLLFSVAFTSSDHTGRHIIIDAEGIVTEKAAGYPAVMKDIVGLMRGANKIECREKARRLLEQVGLRGFEDAYPKALSHGMRQRVALARTFCLDSPILLMDEPFGALDVQTKLQLADVLLNLWSEERRTVVFITHDLSEAIALSDRVIVMKARPGAIIADIPIDLPRPRSARALQGVRQYHDLYARVWNELESALE